MAVRRGQLPPADLINQLEDRAEATQNVGGPGVAQYADGAQFLPPESDDHEKWIIIFGSGSSSSSSSSQAGGVSSSPTQKSNRYNWYESMTVIDANGLESVIVNPSGLSGTSELNPAIEIQNRLDVPEGAITRAYLSPSRNAWHFTYNGPVSTSSSPLQLTIDCANGNISVGVPPASSSSTTSSNVLTTKAKNDGGGGTGPGNVEGTGPGTP